MYRTLGLLAFALTLVASACSFDFDRFVELQPGDIAGRLVRENGDPAAYAQVRVEGTSRLYTTGSDGRFLIRGLPAGGYTLRFSEDENGDGLIERATLRTAALNVMAHADGLFGSETKLSFVSLGDVSLAGVVEVTGRVDDEGGAPIAGAEVYVVRDAELPEAFIDTDGTVRTAATAELTVEARTSTKDDGTFSFLAIAAGDFKVLAAKAQDDDTSFVSEPRAVSAEAGDAVDIEITPLLLSPPPPTERQVQLELVPTPTERVKLFLAEAKTDTAPANAFADFTAGQVFAPGPSVSTTVPLGVHSVFVGTESGAVASLGVHVASRPGEPLVIWGLGFLSDDPPCPMVLGGRDCDRDGAREIPPGNRVTQAILQRCADECAAAFGSANGDATCEVSGITYDCDDDGDGQPDMTEPFACRTLNAGGDWDHDGLCAIDDPFDDCASNNPADPACGAGTYGQDPPPIGPEYDGEDYVEGGFDGGPTPTDAGPGDAGDQDAGVQDAGGGDAGDTDAGPTTDAGDDAGTGGDAGPLPDGQSVVDLGPACALNSSEGFVALFDGAGECLWVRTVALTGNAGAGFNFAHLRTVTGLPDGSVAVGGYVAGGVDFLGTPGVSLSADAEHGFVVVYDFAGEPLIGRTLPSTFNGTVVEVGALLGAPGELLVMGQFAGTLDLAGGQDPALTVAAASRDAYVARLGADLSAQWLVPMGAAYATLADGAMTATGSTEYAVLVGRFSGTLLPGDADRADTAGTIYIVSIYDDGTVQAWASVDGLGAEPLVAGGSRARSRMILGGVLEPGNTAVLTDVDGTAAVSVGSGGVKNGVIFNLDHNGYWTGDDHQIIADTGLVELGDVSMDDRGTMYVVGRFTGDARLTGTGPTNMSTPSALDARAFVASWRQTAQSSQLNGHRYAVVNDSTGAATSVVTLADHRAFVFGDAFADASFEGALVDEPQGQKTYVWRLSDSLLELQQIVVGDTWVRELARQRFVEIKAATGLADGGFALLGTYPVTSPSLTPPLDLGGACPVLDRPEEFSFIARFSSQADGARCQWVRTVETYREADAGPGNTATTFQKAVVELPSGHLVAAMEVRDAELTWGDNQAAEEQRFDPVPYRSGVVSQYTATGALVRITPVVTTGASTDLTDLTRSQNGGFAITGATPGTLRIDPAGVDQNAVADPSVTRDVFFAGFTDQGVVAWATTGGTMDTGATVDSVRMVFAGGELVATGFGSGTIFGGGNTVTADNSSMWLAGVDPGTGAVDWTSRITGVYGDDVALTATDDGSRVVLATNFGYDDQTPVNVYNTSDVVAFTEPGTMAPATGLFFYAPSTGLSIAHRYIRGSSVNDALAVVALGALSNGDLYVAGDSYNTITAPNVGGGNPTYPSPNTDMAFVFRFTDPGSDAWGSLWIGRSFLGDARTDGATVLADDTMLTWGQAFDDVRYIGWDYLLPGSGPFDTLWFVPPDGDE
jgi:hypothetical protein